MSYALSSLKGSDITRNDPKQLDYLVNTKQHDGKSNKDFITGFQLLATEIENVDDAVVIMAFKRAISPKEQNFYEFIILNSPINGPVYRVSIVFP